MNSNIVLKIEPYYQSMKKYNNVEQILLETQNTKNILNKLNRYRTSTDFSQLKKDINNINTYKITQERVSKRRYTLQDKMLLTPIDIAIKTNNIPVIKSLLLVNELNIKTLQESLKKTDNKDIIKLLNDSINSKRIKLQKKKDITLRDELVIEQYSKMKKAKRQYNNVCLIGNRNDQKEINELKQFYKKIYQTRKSELLPISYLCKKLDNFFKK